MLMLRVHAAKGVQQRPRNAVLGRREGLALEERGGGRRGPISI
jgi:hypothetical protein